MTTISRPADVHERLLQRERETMSCSIAQAKIALRHAGLLDAVDAEVAASGNPDLQTIWAQGNTIRRLSPTVVALAGPDGLDWPGTLVDDLFRAAAQIEI